MKKDRRVIRSLELKSQCTEHRAANHELVLRMLLSAQVPMTAYEILRALLRYGIKGPPTVYRALDRLMDSGHIHRLESINSYLACANQRHSHGLAAFAICRKCGDVQELAERSLTDHLKTNAKQSGFHVDAATIELKGQCASCSKDRLAQ
jgi:Fur family zinc uptake transcriptional regulator